MALEEGVEREEAVGDRVKAVVGEGRGEAGGRGVSKEVEEAVEEGEAREVVVQAGAPVLAMPVKVLVGGADRVGFTQTVAVEQGDRVLVNV